MKQLKTLLFFLIIYSALSAITISVLCLAFRLQRDYLDVYQTLQECQYSESLTSH